MAKALILGLQSLTFSDDERAFFKAADPWGLILFKRNIANRAQIRALTAEFRDLVGRDDAPVLIDQEGGRVQRMSAPEWKKYPPAAHYLKAANGDIEKARDYAYLGARMIAHDLNEVGITIDCAPVLDCPVIGATDAIGDRAFAFYPDAIAMLARAFAEGLMDGGLLPVIKHIPGHGRAMVDSHLDLPVVSASHQELSSRDFKPFRALADLPIGMTAHIRFDAIDPERPATQSPVIIHEIIRGEIGFQGLLLSDDVSMKALGGTFRSRTEALFEAGCDIALHCNGEMAEAEAVAAASPELAGEALRRADLALSRRSPPKSEIDPVDAARKLADLLALAP